MLQLEAFLCSWVNMRFEASFSCVTEKGKHKPQGEGKVNEVKGNEGVNIVE